MQISPLRTPLIQQGDDLAAILMQTSTLRPGDCVVVSSKAAATAEGAAFDLSTVIVTKSAREWAERSGRSDAFCQAVMEEAARLHGTIVSASPGALLCELRPQGFPRGTLLVPNAGLDESNIAPGFAIGWPQDPVQTVRTLRHTLTQGLSDPGIAVILSDSCCSIRRWGVTAFALTVSGLDPIASQVGRHDLFGRPLQITREAVADQLATAANMVMGNAGQSIPAAIIRDHGLVFSEYEGWVWGVEREEDLFRDLT